MVTVVCRQLCAASNGGFVIPYNRIRKKKINQKRMSVKLEFALDPVLFYETIHTSAKLMILKTIRTTRFL